MDDGAEPGRRDPHGAVRLSDMAFGLTVGFVSDSVYRAADDRKSGAQADADEYRNEALAKADAFKQDQ